MILPILIAFLFPALGLAVPCVSFDANFNLYAFGVQGQYNWGFGKEDSSWTSSAGPNVTTISSENAPPMNGNNTQCFNIQFFNAIYVLDGDAANPSDVHIFDANKGTWSIQTTTLDSGFDPTSATAIIDHDTNVFFALSPNGDLYQLDMSNQNQAKSDPNKWQNLNTANFKTDGYIPTMAIADNHVFFLGVPGNNAGEANIFVIHFNYFQPDVQAFDPADKGSTFPATGGSTASIFQSGFAAQKQFAFFPNDGSNTYVVDVIHNTTSALPYPPAPPSSGFSSFAGSLNSLVQLTPSGELYVLDIDVPKTGATTATGGWSKINNGQWHTPSASQIASATPNPTGAGGAQSTSSSGGGSKSAGFVNSWNASWIAVVFGAMVFSGL